MPFEIDHVNGIVTAHRNAGAASGTSFQSMSRSMPAIKNPTTTSALAVAAGGTTPASGATNIAARNSTPVTTDARPVRAPAAMPAADSMYVVADDALAAPPAIAASESTSSTRRMR